MPARTNRAKPLSPEERRVAILEAITPLLVDRGASVTTAEMAEAAGIAEGTIFRVFPDKPALLHAVIASAMDPTPITETLDGISAESPLEEQVVEATEALVAQFESVTALLGMLRSIPHEQKPHAESHKIAHDSMTAVATALTTLFDRHRDRLLIEPGQAAVVLRGLVFTNAHHLLCSDERMTPAQIAEILLHGIVEPGNA